MATHGASWAHTEPLFQTRSVEAVSTVADARRTGDGVLTNGTVRVCDSDVSLCCCPNLLLTGIHRNRVKEAVSTDVHPKRDVHHHSRTLRVRHILAEDSECSSSVPKMRRGQVSSGVSIKKANHAKKCLIRLKDVLECVQYGIV